MWDGRFDFGLRPPLSAAPNPSPSLIPQGDDVGMEPVAHVE